MKLATLNDGTRDGQLAVVSRDLKTAHLADGIAPTLQAALDDWAFIAPQLDELSRSLNSGRALRSFDFDPARCMAPLPRAYQWVDSIAYPHHEQLLRKVANADAADLGRDQPFMLQRAGDNNLGGRDDIVLAHEQWGIDFSAEIAAITGDVPTGATPDQAYQQIKLFMLVNNVTLRSLASTDAGAQLHAKPAPACSPVAVTPDEFGDEWKDGKIKLALRASWNGKLVGQARAGDDMAFNYPQLIAHLCHTRDARAGCVVSAGPVSNEDGKRGYSSIAGKRALELLADGIASTPYMLFGDTISIDMPGSDGKSLFGAIEQTVKQAEARKLR